MGIVYQLAAYPMSRDYDKLADAALRHSLICVVDYEEGLRDVAHTIYQPYKESGCWQLSGRGISYVHAFSRDEFIKQCRHRNVEFLDPELLALREC